MKKLFAALALIASSALAYRYAIDRLRAQVMGAAHPAGAMSAVYVPRRMRTRRAAVRRFRYEDATQALDATWIDEQRIVRSATPAGDDATSAKTVADAPRTDRE